MIHSKWVLLLFSWFLLAISQVAFAAQTIPTVDIQQQFKNGKASLAGEWALSWGEWVSLQDIAAAQTEFSIVELPNFIDMLVDENALKEHRFGTYSLKLSNLGSTFDEPAIRMRSVRDAWQAWWISDNGQSQFLGESGKISKDYEGQKMRFQTDILQLPQNVDSGILVIYLSAHIYQRAGVYGEFEVTELELANRWLLMDLAIRAALIAIGLLVVFQNLLFFFFRPKERVLLLLAIFAFSISLRALVATDYAYYFLSDYDRFDTLTRLKYILAVWPAVAGVHFFSCLYSAKFAKLVVQLGYAVLGLLVIVTFLLPMRQMVSYLVFYQMILAVFAFYALWLAIQVMLIKSRRSILMAVSGFVLFAGVSSDVIASQSSGYNVFLSEYALFLFLFVQTQYHSLRFVAALELAEHLTDNLQQEVAEKTKQLSIRNQKLAEKADYLKVQHDHIKQLSETDHLTGLYTRQTLDDYLDINFQQAVKLNKELSLVILDIDNFKTINDTYGHLVGDKCLQAIAEYLGQANLRENDFIARYGGEEMVIVLADTSLEKATEISQKICRGIAEIEINAEQANILLTASFGVAERNRHLASSPEQLFKLADDALYRAKAQGKNQVVSANIEPAE